MNYMSRALAALGGTVASFVVGGLIFFAVPALINEAHKFPAVFRPKEEMTKVMPVGILGTFVSALVAAAIYAMIPHAAPGSIPGATQAAMEGARFGALLGIFVVCVFVLHNYVNLNISLKLALGQAAAYFVQWVVIGTVIALIYKPVALP
jgi:hypothetical protein